MVILAKNKTHLIIKRDGREEPFMAEKLYKVCLWACNGNTTLTDELMTSLDIKINNRMKIQDLYDELISTASNKISPMYPIWDEVAKRLLLMKFYKESYNLKTTGTYPDLMTVLNKGIVSKIYDPDVINSFTQEELSAINDMIVPDYDMMFTFKGLYIFNSKYCKSIKKAKLELPQITYMVASMYSFYTEPDSAVKLYHIKKQYEMLATQQVTFASPRISNSMTPKPQLASCILNTPDDDTWSINRTDANVAIYSKFGGGIAWDVSNLRASGSAVESNRGFSGGPVLFTQRTEKTVGSFDQGGLRKGACVVTFAWWHYDVMDMIMLKDEGGTESTRARNLMYSMRISNLLKDRTKANEMITLFDPKEVPLLNQTYGKEFEEAYRAYEAKPGIRKKKIRARELMALFMKLRTETGNVYCTFVDNINEQNVRPEFVGASNLCTEITVSSNPSELVRSDYWTNSKGETEFVEVAKNGEIGICNLGSVNVIKWYYMTEDEKALMMRTFLRGCDNVIDTQFYPALEGEVSNKKHRPIGIGILNFAYLLAKEGLHYTDEATKEFMFKLTEDLYWHVYNEACNLAIERGAYATFKKSKWSQGLTPFHLALSPFKNQFKLSRDWDQLGQRIATNGIRFSLCGAIAPTATSGKSISATESTEPITDLFFIEEGTQTLPALVPEIQKCREFYDICWEVPARTLIDLASIRQIFIDQSQSVNLYYVKPESTKELLNDIFYAMDVGLKTLYYMKTPKSNYTGKVCESCT